MIRRFLPVLGVLALLLAGTALASARTAQDEPHHRGRVEAMPDGGAAGDWTIGGLEFVATDDTEIEGPLEVGACAVVSYEEEADQRVAREIAHRHAEACERDEDPGDHEGARYEGVIRALPDGLVGEWQIGEHSFLATERTRFEQDEGPFEVGGCAEVLYRPSDAEPFVAYKIESDGCEDEEDEAHEATGIVMAIPDDGGAGQWVIGDQSYQATEDTVLVEDHGELLVGTCAEVKYVESDAGRVALRIASKSGDACGDDEEEHPDLHRAHGLIEAMPTDGLIGNWLIDGVAYESTADTEFEREHGDFVVGHCVSAKFYLEGDRRLLAELESEPQHECRGEGEEATAFGVIESLPATETLRGAWIIGGETYSVTERTELEHGPFEVGLRVKVKYVRHEGARLALEIEGKRNSEDNGSGFQQAYGAVETRPTDTLTGTWTIGGISYQAIEHTRFEPADGPAVGDCAKVRYVVRDGTRIARKIEAEEEGDCADEEGQPVRLLFGFVDRMPDAGYVGTWLIGEVPMEVSAQTIVLETHGEVLEGSYVLTIYHVDDTGVRRVLLLKSHVPPGAGDRSLLGHLLLDAGTRRAADRIVYVDAQAVRLTQATIVDDSVGALQNGQPVAVNAYEENGQWVATHLQTIGAIHSLYMPLMR